MSYSAKTYEELDIMFSILKEKFPKKQVIVNFDYNSKLYTIKVSSKKLENQTEIQVPVDIVIKTIYGDTDSIFLSCNYNRTDFEKNMKDTFRLAKLCGKKITNEVFKRPPIDLEFEKIFNPLILMAKKNYIGVMYENEHIPTTITKITNKGVALTRRNYCALLKECYTKVRDNILTDGYKGLDKSISQFKQYIIKIIKYDVEIDQLIITAALNKDYKNENMPHVQLAKKMRARKEIVQVGERIPYIFVENKNPKAANYDKSEDPTYAKEYNLKIDRGYYIDHIRKPIMAFLKIVMIDDIYKDKLDNLNLFLKEAMKQVKGDLLEDSKEESDNDNDNDNNNE